MGRARGHQAAVAVTENMNGFDAVMGRRRGLNEGERQDGFEELRDASEIETRLAEISEDATWSLEHTWLIEAAAQQCVNRLRETDESEQAQGQNETTVGLLAEALSARAELASDDLPRSTAGAFKFDLTYVHETDMRLNALHRLRTRLPEELATLAANHPVVRAENLDVLAAAVERDESSKYLGDLLTETRQGAFISLLGNNEYEQLRQQLTGSASKHLKLPSNFWLGVLRRWEAPYRHEDISALTEEELRRVAAVKP